MQFLQFVSTEQTAVDRALWRRFPGFILKPPTALLLIRNQPTPGKGVRTWNHLQGGNRDDSVQNGHVQNGGEGGTNWEIRTEIYSLPGVKEIARGKLP